MERAISQSVGKTAQNRPAVVIGFAGVLPCFRQISLSSVRGWSYCVFAQLGGDVCRPRGRPHTATVSLWGRGVCRCSRAAAPSDDRVRLQGGMIGAVRSLERGSLLMGRRSVRPPWLTVALNGPELVWTGVRQMLSLPSIDFDRIAEATLAGRFGVSLRLPKALSDLRRQPIPAGASHFFRTAARPTRLSRGSTEQGNV